MAIIMKAKIEYVDNSFGQKIEKTEYMHEEANEANNMDALGALKNRIFEWRRNNGYIVNRVLYHGGPETTWDESNPNIYENSDNYNS